MDDRSRLRNIHDWRRLVPLFIARHESHSELSQIYCFGAAHGNTVIELVEEFRHRRLPLPHFQVFDSFRGLPAEDAGVPAAPNFVEGAYACSLQEFLRRTERLALSPVDLTIHEGWFRDTLTPHLISGGHAKPAMYVDIDADLYSSTRDALRFMLSHALIRPGTLIGYDDWGDSVELGAGESRAHLEAASEFGMKTTELFSWGEPPLVRKLFRVEHTRQPLGHFASSKL